MKSEVYNERIISSSIEFLFDADKGKYLKEGANDYDDLNYPFNIDNCKEIAEQMHNCSDYELINEEESGSKITLEYLISEEDNEKIKFIFEADMKSVKYYEEDFI